MSPDEVVAVLDVEADQCLGDTAAASPPVSAADPSGVGGEGGGGENGPVRSNSILSTSAGTHLGAFGLVEWLLFWSVGTIWGSSFLLMDIGLDAFSPGLITWMRVGSGAAVLTFFPAARKPVDKADWPRLTALSVLWVAVPFTLFPIAQQWISSAVAGMLNGAVPWTSRQRLSRRAGAHQIRGQSGLLRIRDRAPRVEPKAGPWDQCAMGACVS